MKQLPAPTVKQELCSFEGSRAYPAGPQLYPGVYRRRWILIPATGVWFCIGMEPHE